VGGGAGSAARYRQSSNRPTDTHAVNGMSVVPPPAKPRNSTQVPSASDALKAIRSPNVRFSVRYSVAMAPSASRTAGSRAANSFTPNTRYETLAIQ